MHCYYCLVHYTVLFHSQGGYYNTLILQALELLLGLLAVKIDQILTKMLLSRHSSLCPISNRNLQTLLEMIYYDMLTNMPTPMITAK